MGRVSPTPTSGRSALLVLIAGALSGLLSPGGPALGEAPPDDAGQRWEQRSDNARFHAVLTPEDGSVRFSQFQTWVLTLLDATGAPVYPARIGVGGGMPEHGHGLPTQPVVTDYLGEGRYLVEGVKLNMAGRWVLAFAVETPAQRDRLVFDVIVDY